MKRILLLHGPNLNLLGTREPEIYGSRTLSSIVEELRTDARDKYGFELDDFQSNYEGALIEKIQDSYNVHSGIIFNPGAYTHTSVAICDACKVLTIPIIEVHISNIYQRESFRHHSYISPLASGIVAGFGTNGYKIALDGLMSLIK